ncbi:hypothetical protein [Olsenella sp. HMSC062G07]|uniref:hypothetical protein n=1 Tax=Olsenella sp. HMSC062G07 TaxID=1739330 RepID=UPI0008A44918|nr:hypothetical protein [Olsenella sp. HMSC062G07]OFK23300.1 hypothetical protein HMPREF2826_05145 [Olsenella sp. HMSC062G07]
MTQTDASNGASEEQRGAGGVTWRFSTGWILIPQPDADDQTVKDALLEVLAPLGIRTAQSLADFINSGKTGRVSRQTVTRFLSGPANDIPETRANVLGKLSKALRRENPDAPEALRMEALEGLEDWRKAYFVDADELGELYSATGAKEFAKAALEQAIDVLSLEECSQILKAAYGIVAASTDKTDAIARAENWLYIVMDSCRGNGDPMNKHLQAKAGELA